MTQHHPRGRHERRSRPPSLGPHTLILPTPSSINIMHSKARGYFRQQRCVPSLHSTPWSLWVAPRTSHFWRCYPSQPKQAVGMRLQGVACGNVVHLVHDWVTELCEKSVFSQINQHHGR